MKKLLLLTIILIGIIMAETIDLEKSKGIDQEVINSLSPTPASFTVDENSTIEATFDIELQQKPISMREIKLKKIEQDSSGGFFSNFNSKNKNIDGKISYSQDKKSIIFKPNQPLDIGYYEVEFKRLFSKLTPTTPMKYKHIKNIKYRFYVPEVINGHMLPPEPDEAENNATLGGVDINNNGVRDDVERNICKKYANPLHSALFMYEAKFCQRTLVEPTSNAIEIQKDATKTIDCEMYLMDFDEKLKQYGWGLKNFRYVKNITFNNADRVEKYLKYNLALSGGSYGSSLEDENIDACSPEVVNVLKGIKK